MNRDGLNYFMRGASMSTQSITNIGLVNTLSEILLFIIFSMLFNSCLTYLFHIEQVGKSDGRHVKYYYLGSLKRALGSPKV